MHPTKIKKFFIASSCAAMALYASSYVNPAFAETSYDGFYIGAIGGIAFTSNVSVTFQGIHGSIKYFVPFNGGTPFTAGGVGGYKYGPFRYEAEIAYMKSPIKNFFFNFANTPSILNGNTNVIAGMANLYYDFDQSGNSTHFYLGAGAGYAGIENSIS